MTCQSDGLKVEGTKPVEVDRLSTRLFVALQSKSTQQGASPFLNRGEVDIECRKRDTEAPSRWVGLPRGRTVSQRCQS